MQCPICKNSLEVIEHEGQQLKKCIQCSGLLLGTDVFKELQKENDHHLASLLSKDHKESTTQKGTRKCPSCNGDMKMSQFEWNADVEIDYCKTCSLIWLDRGELDRIHEHIKQEYPDLIESEFTHDTRKFFNWIKYLLSKAEPFTPKVG